MTLSDAMSYDHIYIPYMDLIEIYYVLVLGRLFRITNGSRFNGRHQKRKKSNHVCEYINSRVPDQSVQSRS